MKEPTIIIKPLTTAVEKKKPSSGLIPRIIQMPDSPGLLIITWDDIQQRSALELTPSLRHYWKSRGNIQLQTSSTQWQKIQEIMDDIARDLNTGLKRKKTTQKHESVTQDIQVPKRITG